MIKEIKFTDKALKQINVLLSKKDKGSFFRIAIKGGGCSGFQYEFTFDKEKAADALKLTATDMLNNKLIDGVIKEPLGGAHANQKETFDIVKAEIKRSEAIMSDINDIYSSFVYPIAFT